MASAGDFRVQCPTTTPGCAPRAGGGSAFSPSTQKRGHPNRMSSCYMERATRLELASGIPQRLRHLQEPCRTSLFLRAPRRWRQRVLSVYKKRTSRSDVLLLYGAGNEARTRFRHPANGFAICRNPAAPLFTRSAPVEAARSFRLCKKEDIQIGCPLAIWSGQRGSNSLPPPWQGGALPDELCPRNKEYLTRHYAPCQGISPNS